MREAGTCCRVWFEADGVSRACGAVDVFDKVILKRSIMSLSFVVHTGAGGSGRAKALQGVAVESLGIDVVVLLESNSTRAPAVSADEL